MVLFPIRIITLFWKDQIGLSIADIMTLQAIFGLAVVVFEFPSGYAADRVGSPVAPGRHVLRIAGWVAYALGTTFLGMVVAEVVLGASMAFASGADSALLFTTLQAGRTRRRVSALGRTRARHFAGERGDVVGAGRVVVLPDSASAILAAGADRRDALGTVAAMQEAPRAEVPANGYPIRRKRGESSATRCCTTRACAPRWR